MAKRQLPHALFATVKVANKMPSWMSHFRAGGKAIIIEVGRCNDYGISHLNTRDEIEETNWWYNHNQLTVLDDSNATRKKNMIKYHNKYNNDDLD